MKRLFVCIILLCVFCSCARTPAKLPEQTSDSTAETSAVYTPKPDEIRAVWISCYELPDAAQGEEKFRERAEEMFNNVADMKLNTVLSMSAPLPMPSIRRSFSRGQNIPARGVTRALIR